MWYTREEQALVIGAFYSMNGFQQCVGGLIAYGIAQLDHLALKNWQILFTVKVISNSAHTLANADTAAWMLYICLGDFCALVAS